MDLTNIKDEFYNFIEKLYVSLKEELRECSNINEINEIFHEEYNNLNDYKKVVRFNTISKIKEELMNKIYPGDAIKKALEIENIVGEIEIPHIQFDRDKVYISEDNVPIIEESKNEEKKSVKIIIVTLITIIGATFGWILKRGILDAIIMGLIGALIGSAVYEVSFGGDNKKLEKVIKKNREINKRIDMNYLNLLLQKRKLQIENVFANYINEFSNSSWEMEK